MRFSRASSATEPVVSVVVPAYNATETIPRTLVSLAAQDLGEPYEVIVVDDGSTDGTADAVRAADGAVTLVQERGGGASSARNTGARRARAPLIAFTDSDCYPTAGWLRAGVARLRAGADLVQGHVHPAQSDLEGPFLRRLWATRDAGLHETANLFVTREAFEGVGGFEPLVDHRGGRPMGEDTWFGWRVRRSGGRFEFAEEAVVEHAVLDRGGRDFVQERRRDEHFPAMAAAIPELRRSLFFGRIFLSRRSAAFDAALAGLAVALLRRSLWPLAACVPYTLIVRQAVTGWGRTGLRLAGVHALSDAVGFISLVRGTVRTRTPVL